MSNDWHNLIERDSMYETAQALIFFYDCYAVIRNNEHYQEQMQALQQQVEQMGQQMQQMQEENQNLRKENIDITNALADVGTTGGGGGFVPQPGQTQIGQANSPDTTSAVVSAARNMMGQPTGEELPT